jgi:hypothetical protein
VEWISVGSALVNVGAFFDRFHRETPDKGDTVPEIRELRCAVLAEWFDQ